MTDSEKCDLQRQASAAYDAGDMETAHAVLKRLGAKNFAEGLKHLIDGSVLNKHLGIPKLP